MATPTDDILAMLLNSTAYGSGDEYLNAGSNPYGRLRNRTAAIKDIESLTGMPFIQLAGVTDAPDGPSEIESLYGSNPHLAKAFQAIQAGADPLTVTAAWEESIAKGQAAREGQPGYIAPDTFRGITEQYARERLRGSSGPTFTRPDGGKFKGAPLGGNDIYASASERELWGNPTEQEIVNIVSRERAVPQARLAAAQAAAAGGGGIAATIRSIAEDKRAKGRGTIYDAALRTEAHNRTNQAGRNMVRSDANKAAMQRILALQTLLQG